MNNWLKSNTKTSTRKEENKVTSKPNLMNQWLIKNDPKTKGGSNNESSETNSLRKRCKQKNNIYMYEFYFFYIYLMFSDLQVWIRIYHNQIRNNELNKIYLYCYIF